jgi:hypothetical protein
MERQMLDSVLAVSFLGTAAEVQAGLADFQARTQASELMISCNVYDHDLRQRSIAQIAG